MKHLIVMLMYLAVGSLPARAVQFDRLGDLADRLALAAERLASEGYRGFVERRSGTRADVDALFHAQQFSAAAALFRRLIADGRPVSELQDAAAILQEQSRGAACFGFGRRSWQEMEATVADIVRELERRAPPVARQGARTIGRLRWRGRVDNEVTVSVQGSAVTVHTIAGLAASNSSFEFTSPLPQHELNVEVRKLKGRGTVEVIQHPSRLNGYTAVVRIRDDKGGQDNYEFELVW